MADRQTTVSGEWLVTDFDAVPITYRATYPATLKDGHRGPGGFDVPFVTLDVARQIADDQQEMVAAAIAAADASDVEMDTLVETSEGVFTLTASYGEQWNVTAGADGLYDFGFGWSWYEVDTPEPEETISADDDEWTCICGNDAMDSGCDHCDAIFGTAEEAEQHESMPHADEEQRAAMLADLVPLARGEILADVLAGRVEPDVPDFRSLHDFVDANEYGSPDLRRVPMSVVAALQEDLDEWIRSGQMAKTVRGLRGEE